MDINAITAELRGLLDKATPPPWKWHVTTACQHINIENPHWVVMKFQRYGMSSAAPAFRVDGIMERADKLTKSLPGKEHHKGFDDYIDHPDAMLMVAAVNAVPALLAELSRLRAELARERERAEGAIAEIRNAWPVCRLCIKHGPCTLSDGKMDDFCRTCLQNSKCNWEWRGITPSTST